MSLIREAGHLESHLPFKSLTTLTAAPPDPTDLPPGLQACSSRADAGSAELAVPCSCQGHRPPATGPLLSRPKQSHVSPAFLEVLTSLSADCHIAATCTLQDGRAGEGHLLERAVKTPPQPDTRSPVNHLGVRLARSASYNTGRPGRSECQADSKDVSVAVSQLRPGHSRRPRTLVQTRSAPRPSWPPRTPSACPADSRGLPACLTSKGMFHLQQ